MSLNSRYHRMFSSLQATDSEKAVHIAFRERRACKRIAILTLLALKK